MLYEVCYCALLSISVVEATHGRVARGGVLARGRGRALSGLRRSRRARSSIFRLHFTPPQDSLAGGPPARWFVIVLFRWRPFWAQPWEKH